MSLIGIRELYQYIQAYYPWYSDDQARSYLIHKTPWPIIKRHEAVKAYIRTNVLNNWEEYITDLKNHGYEGAEKPDALIMHPIDMIWIGSMAVPDANK